MCRMHVEELHLLLDFILHYGLLSELQKPSKMFKRKRKGGQIQDLEKYLDTLRSYGQSESVGKGLGLWILTGIEG